MFDEDKIPTFYIPNLGSECLKNCVVVLNDQHIQSSPLKTVYLDKVFQQPEEENNQKAAAYEGLPPGSLLWASLSKKAPLWPCILVEGSSTEKATPQYHVKFFNDSGRSAWVSTQNTLEFTEKNERMIQKIRNFQKIKLEGAVAEAKGFVEIPLGERLQIFTDLVKTQKAAQADKTKRKREELRNISQNVSKKFKLDNGESVDVRKKSTELSESGISTSGSLSPCLTPDFISLGTITPIRLTPEPPAKKVREPLNVVEFFKAMQDDIKADLTISLRKNDRVCRFCGKTNGPLIMCTGRCSDFFHRQCTAINVDLSNSSSSVEHKGNVDVIVDGSFCHECAELTTKVCFICQKDILTDNVKCKEKLCARSYHRDCLKNWPQCKITHTVKSEKFITCPQHICHICSSDDPSLHTVERKMKLLKCILCPSAYHSTPRCVPAGCEILSSTRIICPKHWKLYVKHSNVNWCFICAEGGDLLCCDNCPSAVHEICAKISATTESYICDDCESGRTMVFGNLVWAKQASYRWWPAVVVTENCVPNSMLKIRHNRGDISVFFLGSHNWAWLPRKRMFLYQEDDAEFKTKKSDQNSYFDLALREADHLYHVLKQLEAKQNEKVISKIEPPFYKKIIRNTPVAPVTVKDTITDYDDTNFRCTCDEFDKCGPQSSCCNRNLQIECTDTNCNLQNCENRRFNNRKYPLTEIVLTPNCGFGLVAKEGIQEGEFVIEYVGEILNEAEVERRIKYKREERNNVYYFLTLTKDLTIDAEHKGNNARFINHSCDPNCVTQKWSVNGSTRVGIFALQDISQGTELTFDYHWEKRDSVGTICNCGALKCSGLIGSDRQPRHIRKKLINYKSPKV